MDRLALDEQLALVVRMNAGQDLDQRRLARPVVPQHACHLAGVDLHRDVTQRDDTAEILAYMPGLEKWHAIADRLIHGLTFNVSRSRHAFSPTCSLRPRGKESRRGTCSTSWDPNWRR